MCMCVVCVCECVCVCANAYIISLTFFRNMKFDISDLHSEGSQFLLFNLWAYCYLSYCV